MFFSDKSKGFKLDKAKNDIYLSKILDWFAEDFGNNNKAVIERIISWLPKADQAYVKANSSKLDIEYFDYSWKLNK